jgi:hypothetical protein
LPRPLPPGDAAEADRLRREPDGVLLLRRRHRRHGRNDLTTVTNEQYVIQPWGAVNPGWQLLFSGTGHGTGHGTWKAPQQQSGDRWELNGTF